MSTVDKQLEEVRATIDEEVPTRIAVSDVTYEGPELVIYTRDPEEFATDAELVRRLASQLQKRITIRPDPSVLTRPSDAEDTIRDLIPDDVEVAEIQFLSDTGEVTIRTDDPDRATGRRDETLREITAEVGWTPNVVRTPATETPVVSTVQDLLVHQHDERRDILERVGRQIHREPMSDEQWVRITTLGGCQEVGRTAAILSTANTRILIDCGDKRGEQPYLDIPEAIGAGATSLDAVVLTHAHPDHASLVPLLFEHGYDGPVYCTEPTRDLFGLVGLTTVNREDSDLPYSQEMVTEAIKHCIPIAYGNVTDIAPDVRLTLHNAGHVLGSSLVHFHVGDGLYNVAFTGDIDYDDSRLLSGAVNEFPRVETLVMESTYGGRNDYQTDRDDAERQLIDLIDETAADDGTVLVPTDAVGRPQELLAVLNEAMDDGEIPDLPIYVDTSIWEATTVHTAYPEYLDTEMEAAIHNGDPFGIDSVTPVDDDTQRTEIAEDADGAIVLSTSGMLTGGPVRTWLETLASDPDSTLLFTEYQAHGTLGRQIQNGQETVPIGGSDVEIAMRVETLDGFSSHADRQGLENFVKTMRPRPEKVLCVHGDRSSTQDLSSSLYHEYNLRTFTPENLETFRFI
jgi:KH/beta-lactamase-domain protein